jgi:hypothetical protein
MKLSEFVEALKSFFLDFIGYFAPGFFALIVLYGCSTADVQKSINVQIMNEEWSSLLVFFFSYVAGYVIFSITEYTDIITLLFYKGEPDKINKRIENSVEYRLAKETLIKLFTKNGKPAVTLQELNGMGHRSVRSIVMSYIPDADTKIYTFMFRSTFCKNVGSAACAISLAGLIFCIWSYLNGQQFYLRTDRLGLLVYTGLLVISIMLNNPRFYFLSIAYRIHLSIFLAKYYKVE